MWFLGEKRTHRRILDSYMYEYVDKTYLTWYITVNVWFDEFGAVVWKKCLIIAGCVCKRPAWNTAAAGEVSCQYQPGNKTSTIHFFNHGTKRTKCT